MVGHHLFMEDVMASKSVKMKYGQLQQIVKNAKDHCKTYNCSIDKDTDIEIVVENDGGAGI